MHYVIKGQEIGNLIKKGKMKSTHKSRNKWRNSTNLEIFSFSSKKTIINWAGTLGRKTETSFYDEIELFRNWKKTLSGYFLSFQLLLLAPTTPNLTQVASHILTNSSLRPTTGELHDAENIAN